MIATLFKWRLSIANSIDITTFPIDSDYCQCHYCNTLIVRYIVTPLLTGQGDEAKTE